MDAIPEYRYLDLSSLQHLEELENSCSASPWSASLIAKELQNSRTTVEGMFLGGNLVAFLVYQIILDEAHILNFGVTPSRRREGLGRLFLRKALGDFRMKGLAVVVLEVRLSNVAAQQLYNSVGFQVVGYREGYYANNNETAVLMTCPLNMLENVKGRTTREGD